MRLLVLLLLACPLVLASDIVVEAIITIDLLRPIDPEARRGDGAEDFEAAKRILQSDFERLLADPTPENVEQAQRSLSLVGDVGGFDSPHLQKTESRSLNNYRALQQFLEALQEEPEEVQAAIPEPARVTVYPEPEPPVVVKKVLPAKAWYHKNLRETVSYWRACSASS